MPIFSHKVEKPEGIEEHIQRLYLPPSTFHPAVHKGNKQMQFQKEL